MNAKRTSTTIPANRRPPTPEQIAALAHELWRERGSPEGSDIDIWLEAERQLRGAAAPVRGERDPIPADPDRADADSDPALTPETDREIGRGGPGQERSPTSFQL